MANWYVSSVGWTAVTAWAAGVTLAVGALRRQLATPATNSERVFRVSSITTGITGGSEPAWNLNNNGSTTDNGVTWTQIGGQESFQAPGAWAAPLARLGGAVTLMAAGDTVYVAANHAETQSTAISDQGSTSSALLCSVICVDQSGSGHVPPQAGDLKTTATVTTTGASGITIGFGNGYWNGIQFIVGSLSASAANMQFNSASFALVNRFDNCSFQIANTSASSLIALSAAGGGVCIWNNCTVSFGATGQSISPRAIEFFWRNTASALLAGSIPTNLITDAVTLSVATMIYIEGVDLSGLAVGHVFNFTATLDNLAQIVNSKINAATTISGTAGNRPGVTIDAIAVDSAGATYRNERHQYQGDMTTSTAVVRTTGASDGTTAFSWQVITTANPSWTEPFQAFDISQWNTLTGGSHTVSVEAIVNAAAVLTNAQLWIEAATFGTAGSTLESLISSGTATILTTGANITASSAAWDSAATARQNSHAYVVGDIIAAASNAGRIFFCTTSGTSASGPPIAYGSAADGGSVTDGTAVFRAGCRMTVSVTLTPQIAGIIKATPKVAVASTTLFIDPLLTVT